MYFPFGWSFLLACLFICGCTYPLTMQSEDGQQLLGRYRHGREGRGEMQVTRPDGEVLLGTFLHVDRTTFVNNYEKAFGRGSIQWDGPDLSTAGNVFIGILGQSYVVSESASGQKFKPAGGKALAVVSGPLFYWTAFLESDRRASMRCYFIGSAYTGNGFGRCLGDQGTEYSVEF